MLLARFRSAIAAGAVLVAVLAGAQALTPEAAATVPVVTAAKDLRWGATVSSSDVAVTQVPAAAVPDGALTSLEDVRGRLLTSPVRRGEALTDVRLIGPSVLSEPGLVAVGVRLADAGLAGFLRAGSVVDVLAAAADAGFDRPVGPGTAEVVASAVRVLAVPGGNTSTLGGSSDGALVIVAASEAQATRLAAAQSQSQLSLVLRPDSVDAP